MTAPTSFATRILAPHAPSGAEPRWGAASQGQVEQDPALGLIAVAEAEADTGGGGEGVGGENDGVGVVAARLALDQLVAHVRLHGDLVERFCRHPTPALRSRLQSVLREGFAQASREVYALGRRSKVALGVSMDAVLVLPDEAVVGHAGRGEVALLHEGLVHRLTGRAEPVSQPPPRDQTAPPGHDDPLTVIPLMGEGAEPPNVQALTVGLAEGDRVVLLGASASAGLSVRELRRAQALTDLPGLVLDLAQAARVPPERTRLVAACQVGGPRTEGQDRLSLLRGVDLFRWCTDDELIAFVGLTRPRRYREGELLLRQGSVNTTLFLLVSGTVGVNKDGQRIARTGAGSIFGEMSMLDEPRASATVEALSDIEVLLIPRDDFLQALKRDASMAVKVLWSMLLRVSSNLRTTSQRLAAVTAAGVGAPPSDSDPA